MPKATHGGASNSWETPDLGEPEPIAPVIPAIVDVQLPEMPEATTEVETPAEEVSAEELAEPMAHLETESIATTEAATDSAGNVEVMEPAPEPIDHQQEAIAKARALLERYGA